MSVPNGPGSIVAPWVLEVSRLEGDVWRLEGEIKRVWAVADQLAESLAHHRHVHGPDWEGCSEFTRADEEALDRYVVERNKTMPESGKGKE